MADAKRDENFVPTLLAVSSVDGVTPVPVYANPITHRLLVDLPGGTGTVTDVSVVSANGFAGTVATSTSTPAITLTTTITGLLKGNGTAISAAVAGDADLILPTQTGNSGKFLTTDGTNSSWSANASGNVSNTGTPLNNQIAVWTDATTVEGDAALTFDTTTDTLTTAIFNSTSLTASQIVITDASKNLVSAAVATYPSLTELTYVKGVTSPIQTQLGTKQSTITFGTGVQTALGVNIGAAGAPVLFNGALGTPTSGTVTNLTGTASININGTVGATTPTTGAFTTISASSAITASSTLELGHATDTTISRVSAGVIAVEGVTVPTISSTSTLTNKDLSSATNKRPIVYYKSTLNGSTALTTADVDYFRIPAALGGMNLVSVAASVGTGAAGSSSSGTPTFTVTNVTQSSAAMLSTALTVDANHYTSATATTAAVIDTANDDVATDDLLKIAVTTAGTGTLYAQVVLGFQLP